LSPVPSDSEYDHNGYFATLTLKNSQYQVDTRITWKPCLPIVTDHPFVFFNCRMEKIESEQVLLNSKDEFSIISVQTENGLCEVHYDTLRSGQHRIEVFGKCRIIS